MFMRTMLLTMTLVFAATSSVSPTTLSAQDAWQVVSVPDVWKNPLAGVGGYSWYRCAVRIPGEWEGRDLSLFSEPVDDAREVYWNGTRVGGAGGFPPNFRSGLGSESRHKVDPAIVKFGQLNTLAIRVYSSDARTGFNVAAPALFAGDRAMRFSGTWLFQGGDDPTWAKADAAFSEKTTRVEVLSAEDRKSVV